MRKFNANATRMWWGRFFISFVVRGRGLAIGWQWEGDYLDFWHSPIVFINWHRPLS